MMLLLAQLVQRIAQLEYKPPVTLGIVGGAWQVRRLAAWWLVAHSAPQAALLRRVLPSAPITALHLQRAFLVTGRLRQHSSRTSTGKPWLLQQRCMADATPMWCLCAQECKTQHPLSSFFKKLHQQQRLMHPACFLCFAPLCSLLPRLL
jgi:hypothetical protein